MKAFDAKYMSTTGWPFIHDNDPNFNASFELGPVSEEDYLNEVKKRHPDCIEIYSGDIFILYAVDDVPVAWYDDENTFGYIA